VHCTAIGAAHCTGRHCAGLVPAGVPCNTMSVEFWMAIARADESVPPPRSTSYMAAERIAMDGTEQGTLRVLDGARTGGPPRPRINGFRAWR
jgi:hypothetical protein